MSMNLSSLLRVGVSTYENSEMDSMVDQMDNDLREVATTVNTIGGVKKYHVVQVKGIGPVDINDIECEDQLDFQSFKAELGEQMMKAIEYDVSMVHNISLTELFAKYGLVYDGMTFYTPKYYNYESDSLEIRLKTTDDEFSLDKYGLTELVLEYIENERQESYDGYTSFEPTKLDEVAIDDYCTLWAILKKEGVYDTMKEALQDYVNDGYREVVAQHCDPRYAIRMPMEGSGPYTREYFTLDYDNSILLPIE